uniref:Polyprotein n=1 Tax=Actinidia nepovirus TaxID=3115754 RepID=A0AAT9JH34_9SECO
MMNSLSLVSVARFAGVSLPGNVMAEVPSKFPYSKFILESGHIVEVRALTATKLADAYKALCAIRAERRAYKALPAVEKKRLWRARRTRRAKALSKKRAAAAKAAELAAVRLAAKKRAQAKAILKSLEKEPSKAQVACARRFWKKVEARLPPRPTEAQCLLAKYRAWRNKVAQKAAMARYLASLPPPPPAAPAYSKAEYPMGVLSSPPSSPLHSSFGKIEMPSVEGIFPLPPVVKGWRILPAFQRVAMVAQTLRGFDVRLVGRNAFSCMRKAFCITRGLVQALNVQAKYLFGDTIDIFTTCWSDYVSPVQRTGSLKGCYTCLPVLRENCNEVKYLKRISYPTDREGCDCNECISTHWLDMVSPVQRTGSLKGVFNGFPVCEPQYRNDLERSVVLDRSSDEEGCTCIECCADFWMEMIAPVHSAGILKGVFNDFPVFRPEYCNGIVIPQVIDRSSDGEGCSCESCTPTWLDYVSPVQRTGRLHSDYIGVPTFRPTLLKKNGRWDYKLPHGRYMISNVVKVSTPQGCDCVCCELIREGKTYNAQGCVHNRCATYCEPCYRRKRFNEANEREAQRQRSYLGLGKYFTESITYNPKEDRGYGSTYFTYSSATPQEGAGYAGLYPTTPFVFRGDFTNEKTEETCDESSKCYSGSSEQHEEAQLASEQIERNYNLLTPQNLIETALSKEQRGFKVGEGKILGKTHLHEKDVFYIESFLEKMKRKGLGKGLEADSVTTFQEVTKFELVRHPGNKENGKLSTQVFSRLPMMQRQLARKLLEKKSIVNTERTAFDLGLVSHMPQGKPYIALVSVLDGRFDDVGEALLCSSYINLGQKQARLMVAPLVNFPLTQEDITDYLDNLYICTIFYNIGSIRPGAPIFSYGVLEAAEHWDRSNWDVSRFIGDWNKILSGPNKRGGRVLAGFNLESIASAPLDEPIPELNQKLEIVVRPPSAPIGGSLLTTGQKDDAPSFKRSYSISGPANLAGRQTVFSQRFVPPVVKQWEEQTPSRYTASDTYSGMQEEIVNNEFPSISGLFSFEEFKVPLGTTAGKVLCDHQLMASGRSFAGKVWHQLLEMQNFVGDFEFEISLTTTPLLGISIGVCFDFYNSINLTVLKDLPISAGALLPNFVFSPGEKIKGRINIADCLGHSLSARANSFGSGRIIVYTITNSSITAASDFTGVLYVQLTNVKPSTLLLRPLVSLPEFTTDERHSDIGIGKFFKKAQGATSAFSKFNIDFATLVTVLNNKSVLHPAAALQNIMSGQEGDLVLEFQKLSSAFIQASFIVSAWWGTDDHTLDEILRVQHARLDTGSGQVVIPLTTPFGRVPVAEKKAQICLYYDTLPNAPTGYSGAYEGYVKFVRYQLKEFIPKTVYVGNRFAWCQISGFTTGIESFYIPARLADIQVKGLTIEMWDNHLHRLVGTSGIFTGRVRQHLSIAYKSKLTEMNKIIQFQALYGDSSDSTTWQRRTSEILSCFGVSNFSHEFNVGDFSGVTTSAPTGAYENFLMVWTNAQEHISHINVDIEVLNLDFYGKRLVIK